jgi:hypothetical protein
MPSFTHMTDLTRSDEEKSKEHMDSMLSSPFAHMPDVPPGLCICLTETELQKLELDSDCDVGDYLHGRFMARVTSVNKSESGGGARCRIELSLIAMNLENESTEDPDDDDD